MFSLAIFLLEKILSHSLRHMRNEACDIKSKSIYNNWLRVFR